MIDKNLLPSIKRLLSFNKMRNISVQGISFMENKKVKISKSENKFILSFNIDLTEYKAVESLQDSNFPKLLMKK